MSCLLDEGFASKNYCNAGHKNKEEYPFRANK
jgi:hypothetical protein